MSLIKPVVAALPQLSDFSSYTKKLTLYRGRKTLINTVKFPSLPDDCETSALILCAVFLTQSLIWSHIEPNCSIIAACLPTYGLLLKKRRSKFSKMRSPCSILSFGSWCSISGKGASDDPQNSASGSAKTEALGAKMARQQLENGNHSVNLTNVQLGSKRNDLEAQTGHSMEILVTKWFGIEHERA